MVFASDSRTNAGVDQVSSFRKMKVFEREGDRLIVIMSSGNLAITQSARDPSRQGCRVDWFAACRMPAFIAGDAEGAAHIATREGDRERRNQFQFVADLHLC